MTMVRIGEPPISDEHLEDLYEHLTRDGRPACDHTHRETVEFLKARGLPVGETIEWLERNGGYCDCEVLMNVVLWN